MQEYQEMPRIYVVIVTIVMLFFLVLSMYGIVFLLP